MYLKKNHYSDNPKFNFYKYMVRALETDFKKVVGIRYIYIYTWSSLLVH